MVRKFLGGAALLALVACGKNAEQQAAADSLQRDLQLAPAESTTALNDQPAATPAPNTPPASTPAPKPAAPKPAAPKPPATHTYTAATGAVIAGTGNDSLNSRDDKPGGTYHMTVASDILDANGKTVIPAGAIVSFTVTTLKSAHNKGEKGVITLTATEVVIGGTGYAISGSATNGTIEHELKGQGVTAGGAARVGGGAVAGGVAGKVIGGKTGAIIGGIAGAAAGTAVAVQTADKDIIVHPGAKISFTLSNDFSITK